MKTDVIPVRFINPPRVSHIAVRQMANVKNGLQKLNKPPPYCIIKRRGRSLFIRRRLYTVYALAELKYVVIVATCRQVGGSSCGEKRKKKIIPIAPRWNVSCHFCGVAQFPLNIFSLSSCILTYLHIEDAFYSLKSVCVQSFLFRVSRKSLL